MHGKDDYDKLYLALERLAVAAGEACILAGAAGLGEYEELVELGAAADVARRVLAGEL